ncbi:MAG: rod shape-determining protein MreC [Actinomycetota bacterium]|nr:rod shape-determining protein MreC [Actinomycetota bacterium]
MLGLLVLLALVLITISFRERSDGPLHDVQGAVAGALQPVEVAVERVARPFRDAYGWTTDLFNARSDNDQLRTENEQLRQQVIQNESALQENVILKRLLDYKDAPKFPTDYDGVAAEVISQPAAAFEQEIVISAGSSEGVALNAPVVTADGFVGTVTRVTGAAARVRLLTDRASAVSALDLRTNASGIVRPGAVGETLILDRVKKDEIIQVGDEVITAGWRAGSLASLYPKGIPIGRVSFVGQLNTDLWQQVIVVSDVDFSSLDAVLVLVPRRATPELP